MSESIIFLAMMQTPVVIAFDGYQSTGVFDAMQWLFAKPNNQPHNSKHNSEHHPRNDSSPSVINIALSFDLLIHGVTLFSLY